MGATLADGGVNPVTGERVVAADTCARVLAVMATAGLYERSGEWLYDIGLPGKSGVSGGHRDGRRPARAASATFSPPLDAAGNSVRGQLLDGLPLRAPRPQHLRVRSGAPDRLISRLGPIAEPEEHHPQQVPQLLLLAPGETRQDLGLGGHVPDDDIVDQVPPATVRRTTTLRRSAAPARSTRPPLLEPVDAVRDRTGRHHGLARRARPPSARTAAPTAASVASTSYIQFSMPWRAKFSARRRSTSRDRRDTRPMTPNGRTSTSGAPPATDRRCDRRCPAAGGPQPRIVPVLPLTVIILILRYLT